jgi:hypothetical protein
MDCSLRPLAVAMRLSMNELQISSVMLLPATAGAAVEPSSRQIDASIFQLRI